jgi:hypothetical protein
MKVEVLAGKQVFYVPHIHADTDTVLRVKEEIFDHTGVPVDVQILHFAGEKLDNEAPLSAYDIEDSSALSLSFSLDGGANDNVCVICCCVKLTGGGCGCCPLESVGLLCKEGLDPDNEDGEKPGYVCCTIS